MLRQVEDLRPKYAALMREMADRIEQSDKQPEGASIQIFLTGGELVRARAIENGFNLMHAVGCYELIKSDIVADILQGQKRVQ